MDTVSVPSADTIPNPHGVSARKLSESDEAVIMHLTLAPGQALKRHETPVDVRFYVLHGEGIVEIGEQTQRVSADTLVESPKDLAHKWTNEGAEPLEVLVIKTPRPGQPSRMLE